MTVLGNLISAAELRDIIQRMQSGQTTLEQEAAANLDNFIVPDRADIVVLHDPTFSRPRGPLWMQPCEMGPCVIDSRRFALQPLETNHGEDKSEGEAGA